LRVKVSLFRKYVALFLAIVCLALLVNGTFGMWFSYQQHQAALIRIQQEQAVAAAAKIGQFIKEIEAQLGWTTHAQWSAGNLEQRIRDARRLLRQVPAITELAQLDSAGRERLRVSRVAMNVIGSQADFSQDVRFREAVAHKVYYGPVYFRRETEPYMTLALAGTQRDAGVSIAEVNLKLIWDVVSQIKVGEGGHAYVVDAEGRLIAHPDISLVLRNTDLSQLSQVQAARAAGAGIPFAQAQVAQDLQRREVLSAYATIAPLGWRVFIELPLEEAYAPLYASIKREGGMLLAGLALASIAGILLARKMVGPIRTLRAGAARIGSGDLSQRIAVKTGDELEALAEQFNDMASRLQESYADLEKKVESRTAELAQSVAELRALGEVSQAVNSTLDLETVLSTIVAKAVELSGTDAGEISEFDERRKEFLLRATHGMSEAMIAAFKDHHLGTGDIVRQAAAQREPIQIADMRRQPASAARDIVLEAGHRGLLIVPLLRPDRVAGALVVRRKKPGLFPKPTIDLLQTFAAQSVVAIQNARLFSEIEEKRRQLEIAGKQKSRFLAAASHDLRQPLHALSLYTATLKLQAASGVTGEIVTHIDHAVDSLSALVESLLDISRLDAGVVQVEPQSMSVRALLQRIEASYRPVAREKGLQFSVEAEDALVHTDPVLLERLMRNLVDNAFKYTASGGVTLHAEVAGPAARIAVRDTGPGIPVAERERVFEEFYQIGNPERDRARGLGLGLAIVRRLAQLLGLDVKLESEPGRGATFTVSVPLAPDARAEPRRPAATVAPSSRGLAGAQILVIDDEPEVRGGMTMLLEHLGCRVAACGGYAEAEQLLEKQALSVDLIIADFRLRQNESGIDTVRRLRARVGNVPVLLLTGDTAPERLREAQASGLRLLYKPISPKVLTENMLAALQR
jgi:signal transduction histidine kinase/CheY-like chemotaxis protein